MRQIIITDTRAESGVVHVTAYLWLDLPGKRVVSPRASRLPKATTEAPWGITSAEEAEFAKGKKLERVVTAGPFADAATIEDVNAALVLQLNAAQAALDAAASATLDLVGVSYENGAWSAAAAQAMASLRATK